MFTTKTMRFGCNRDCWYHRGSEKVQKSWKKFIHHTEVEVNTTKFNFHLLNVISSLKLHPGKLTCPKKRDYFNRKYIFQPSFFRGYVSFQGGKPLKKTKKILHLCRFELLNPLFPPKKFFKNPPQADGGFFDHQVSKSKPWPSSD